ARVRIDDDRRAVAAGEDSVRRLVVRNAGRAFARRERPRRDGLPGFHVDDLDRVLPFVVHEDMAFAVGRGAFRRVVFEFDRGDDGASGGIECGEGAGGAVIRKDDLVVWLVEHDPVEPGSYSDLLDHAQRLQVEHRYGLIAAVRGKAVAGLRRDAGA